MLFALIGSANAAPKPTQMFEDAAGDADAGQGAGASIPGGWDLIGGTVVKNGANLEFTVSHADMPPIGSAPEMSRFLWNFTVDGEPYRLTVKSVDIGKPDAVGGQTSDRVGRADVTGHFRLEGECVTDASLPLQRVNCPPLEYLEGSFDAATMSFTVIVPLASIKAKTGSIIGPGAENICTVCWVSHVAERSLNNTIIDAAALAASYKIPKK
jgi:hypothetical protein